MKKTKILSAISLLILCICILTVGVISAASLENKMGFGGTITVPANDVDVLIKGYIADINVEDLADAVPDYVSTQAPTDAIEGTVYNTNAWEFTEEQLTKKMVFEMKGLNTKDELAAKSITITFAIYNNSEMDLEVFFSKTVVDDTSTTQQRSTTDTLKTTGGVDVLNVTLGELAGDDCLPAKTSATPVKLVKIKFSMIDFLTSTGATIPFEYKLNCVDKEQVS